VSLRGAFSIRNRMVGIKVVCFVLFSIFILSLNAKTNFIQTVYADSCPGSIGPNTPLAQINTICTNIQNQVNAAQNNQTQTTTTGTTQVTTTASSPTEALQYCQAAQSALAAAHSNDMVWKIWAAVTGVCVASCAAGIAGAGYQYVCMGSAAVAGLADAAVTSNFSSALMAISGVGGVAMMNPGFIEKKKPPTNAKGSSAAGSNSNSTSHNSKTNADTAGKNSGKNLAKNLNDTHPNNSVDTEAANPENEIKREFGACMIATMAAGELYTSYASMQSSMTAAQCSLNAAAGLASSAAANTPTLTQQTQAVVATAPTTTPDNVSTVGSGGDTAQSNGSSSIPTACAATMPNPSGGYASDGSNGGQNNVQNTGMMIDCATATDGNLPSYVGTPTFANAFQKASGMNLGDFLNNSDSPGKALIAAGAGTLNAAQTAKFADAVREFETHFQLPNSAYASGGGGNGGAGNSGEPNLNDALAGIMSQFGPKKEGDPKDKAGVTTVTFGNQGKTLAISAEDRTFSIFDRITIRYHYLGADLEIGTTQGTPGTPNGRFTQ